MLFMVMYKTTLPTARSGQARFIESGGAPPPASITKIASYHYLDGSGGCTIAETDNPVALAAWANDWADVISMEMRPVITDAQLGQVLASAPAGKSLA